MKTTVLATNRHWNWKLFFVLIGLIIPATFAILPYTLNLQDVSPGWEVLLIDRLINALLIALLGGIGILLANRIGLGMPFAEGWVKREPVPYRFRNIAAIAWITAVALVLLSMFLHSVVLDPPLNAMLDKLGIPIPETTTVSPLCGFLASLSAGITEGRSFACLASRCLHGWVDCSSMILMEDQNPSYSGWPMFYLPWRLAQHICQRKLPWAYP